MWRSQWLGDIFRRCCCLRCQYILFLDPTFRRALQLKNQTLYRTVSLRFDSTAAIMATTVDKVRFSDHVERPS
jgi:hypothetical protein